MLEDGTHRLQLLSSITDVRFLRLTVDELPYASTQGVTWNALGQKMGTHQSTLLPWILIIRSSAVVSWLMWANSKTTVTLSQRLWLPHLSCSNPYQSMLIDVYCPAVVVINRIPLLLPVFPQVPPIADEHLSLRQLDSLISFWCGGSAAPENMMRSQKYVDPILLPNLPLSLISNGLTLGNPQSGIIHWFWPRTVLTSPSQIFVCTPRMT